MNSQEYWKKRALLAKQKEMISDAEYEAAMRSRLKDLENELIKETKKWLTKYANENNQSLKEAADYLNSIDTSKFDMTLAEFEAKAKAGGYEKELNSAYYKSRIARLQELYRQYQEIAARYADNEENNMFIGLAKRYEDTYLLENYNKYLVVGGLDVNFAHFNEQELKDIVYQPWNGGNFSKRIWNNYTKAMPEVLTDVMFRSTALGYSYNRIERMLRDKFQGVVKSNIHRLVITEMGHAAEKATAKFYEDSDIEQYQYLATLETHTCEACAHLDERVFNVKDEKEGVNYPLMHPYCRCTTMGYMKDLPDITTRWSRNPKTGNGKWVQDQSYSQWAKMNGKKPYSFSKWKELNGIKPLRLGMLKKAI
ncbi:phage head morphogenesis protein [Lactobacillus helveticus]|uniref:minor capsid protein n=1 Tax=Lactobacillus helveticus TaxID=1587 RepID=UPI0021825348|nr:minor capsid protein [Lactobacillus helveticus]MCT0196532.1 phage head morphogenesis protein [Lactobacillus helveticus]